MMDRRHVGSGLRRSISTVALALALGSIAGPAFAQSSAAPAAQTAAPPGQTTIEAGTSAAQAAPASVAAPPPVQQPEPLAREPGGIGDIVVTARRREESIQNVPISVAAFGGNALAERQIDSSDKLTQLAPNVQFSAVAPASGNSSSSAIFIRGVGQTDFLASTDPGVGFYVDGVYFARASGTAISLLDVERVEVLRGPRAPCSGATRWAARFRSSPRGPASTTFRATSASRPAIMIAARSGAWPTCRSATRWPCASPASSAYATAM
ncbi:TonB-dependent receptor plug domain-containing protein [Novosphingobium lindaniclasticum]|jgi:iron complex outermembrane receptor protein|uniref:TonB-dependent receptor plug domain-containing protein n=1 Tax=Novosphingobium lindaniclasticum TaxID=1329895 RepID=UPI00240A2ECD|nr:TonB-dependent receptor plug domain-containing protein [Novosphingobium lindaniclasticum]